MRYIVIFFFKFGTLVILISYFKVWPIVLCNMYDCLWSALFMYTCNVIYHTNLPIYIIIYTASIHVNFLFI